MPRRPRLLLVVVAAGLLALAAALLWPSGRGSSIVAARGQVALVAASKRRTLARVEGPTLSPPPARLALAQLRGRPLLVDVWASWCVPCREEAPMLARLSRRFRLQVQFVGIDTQDQRRAAQAFARRYKLAFPHLFDPNSALAEKLGILGVPTAVLVDRRGKVAVTLVGKQREQRLRRYLTLLAREAPMRTRTPR